MVGSCHWYWFLYYDWMILVPFTSMIFGHLSRVRTNIWTFLWQTCSRQTTGINIGRLQVTKSETSFISLFIPLASLDSKNIKNFICNSVLESSSEVIPLVGKSREINKLINITSTNKERPFRKVFLRSSISSIVFVYLFWQLSPSLWEQIN